MINDEFLDKLEAWFETIGIELAPGLSDDEIAGIEAKFRITFPQDLRQFLQKMMPVSDPPAQPGVIKAWGKKAWINWRSDDEETIFFRFNWPKKGILFAVEKHDFWLRSWGPRPLTLSQRLESVSIKIASAPILIPVYGHRFLSTEPNKIGNSVLSVSGTDTIFYGDDLASYFAYEFKMPGADLQRTSVSGNQKIRFWSDIVDFNISY